MCSCRLLYFAAILALVHVPPALRGQTAPTSPPPIQGAPVGSAPTPAAAPVRQVGGSVSAPKIISKPPIPYPEAARNAKVSGSIVVHLRVDEQGNPSDFRLVRGIGYGLDENALHALPNYKFAPAMEGGKPVAVEFNMQIDFHADTRQPEPYESDPKFAAAIADGKKLAAQDQFGFAIDAYKRRTKSAVASAWIVLSALLPYRCGVAASRMPPLPLPSLSRWQPIQFRNPMQNI